MTGRELIGDISHCRVAPGGCALWWLGQHGFAVKLGQTVLYIDAFLTGLPGRQIAPMLKPFEVNNADFVLGTHDHADHIDRPAWPEIALASPTARFIVPLLLREQLVEQLGLPNDRVIGADELIRLELGDVTISAVPSAHEFLDADLATGLHPHLGFVVEGNGFCLYHAGDCCLYEGLHEKLRKWKFDLMILPINGRDARRLNAGCIGNMTYQEAVDLSGSIRPGAVIPAHYEMFEFNSSNVADFLEYAQVKYPAQQVIVPQHGQRVIIPATASQGANRS